MSRIRKVERVVAFIDILGFHQIVYDRKKAKQFKDAIALIASFVEELKNPVEDPILNQILGDVSEGIGSVNRDFELTQFSDCIVISRPYRDISDAMDLIFQVVLLQRKLLDMNVVMRGGITFGELEHIDNQVFGRALIEAYELESKVAFYPRVILSQKLARSIDLEKDPALVFPLIYKDSDGFWITNFAFWHCLYGSSKRIIKNIKKEILYLESKKVSNEAHIAKWMWLLTYYQNAPKYYNKAMFRLAKAMKDRRQGT